MLKHASAADLAVQRINVTKLYEVRQWAVRYGCTPQELKAAVCAVGNVAGNVHKHLMQPISVPNGRAALEAAFQQVA